MPAALRFYAIDYLYAAFRRHLICHAAFHYAIIDILMLISFHAAFLTPYCLLHITRFFITRLSYFRLLLSSLLFELLPPCYFTLHVDFRYAYLIDVDYAIYFITMMPPLR